MPVSDVPGAITALGSESGAEIDDGVRYLRERLSQLSEAELRSATEALCSLFYVDTQDRPDLEPSLDLAVDALVSVGPRIVPQLVEAMQGADLKSHFYLARTLAAIGRPAIATLRRLIATENDPYSCSFALFALGKIRSPDASEALPEVIASLAHADREVRDSAARALGKLAEHVPVTLVAELRRDAMFDALFRALADVQPAVRAKAVRSLGKMARSGYLSPDQLRRARGAALRILGRDEAHEWDRAYIVRHQAAEALRHIEAQGGAA